MSFLSKFQTKHNELESCVRSMTSNMSNNYKDAAQSDYRKLVEKFRALEEQGKLNERQRAYYDSLITRYADRLKGYSHTDRR